MININTKKYLEQAVNTLPKASKKEIVDFAIKNMESELLLLDSEWEQVILEINERLSRYKTK